MRETDRELRVRQPRPIRERTSAAWALPHRFDRNSTSASNMNSNRGGTARRRRGGSRGCFCCRLAPEARIAAGGAPDSGCLLLEGSALPRAPHPSARHHERRNGRRRRPPPLMAGSIAANAPDALTGTEPEPVSTSFLRPPAGNWQVAPRICPGIYADRSLREQRDESRQALI